MTDRALLVIDMQKGMQEPRAGRRNNPGAEAQVQRLLMHWRTTGRPVVHVRHMSRFADSVFFPGQPGAEFQDALAPLPTEHVVEKNVTDAFAHSGLERWLRVRGIEALVVVGVATNCRSRPRRAAPAASASRSRWCPMPASPSTARASTVQLSTRSRSTRWRWPTCRASTPGW